jgi:hypothetical protein
LGRLVAGDPALAPVHQLEDFHVSHVLPKTILVAEAASAPCANPVVVYIVHLPVASSFVYGKQYSNCLRHSEVGALLCRSLVGLYYKALAAQCAVAPWEHHRLLVVAAVLLVAVPPAPRALLV